VDTEKNLLKTSELRIQKKIILNKENPNYIEVVIGEMEIYKNRFGESIHYIISFGGDKTIRIIGKKNWNAFINMLQWLEWNPEDTQDLYIPIKIHENTLPYIDSEESSYILNDDE